MSNSGESMGSRVTDWANREITETQSIHIFTFLITMTALQVLTRSPTAVPCCDSSHLYIVDKLILSSLWGKGGGQEEVEPIGERDCWLCVHLEAAEEISPGRERALLE